VPLWSYIQEYLITTSGIQPEMPTKVNDLGIFGY